MGIIRTIFRRNNQIFIAANGQRSATPISSVRRRYMLLGVEYSVQISKGDRNSLKIEGNILKVTLKEMTSENFDKYIEDWYRRTARKIFQEILDKTDTENLKPQIKLYKMRRAWGRCYYQKNVITLNLHLLKAPLECVEYIVLHEYCHFTHHNHSKDFYGAVAECDPDWKRKDVLLKEFTKSKGATLLQRLHI